MLSWLFIQKEKLSDTKPGCNNVSYQWLMPSGSPRRVHEHWACSGRESNSQGDFTPTTLPLPHPQGHLRQWKEMGGITAVNSDWETLSRVMDWKDSGLWQEYRVNEPSLTALPPFRLLVWVWPTDFKLSDFNPSTIIPTTFPQPQNDFVLVIYMLSKLGRQIQDLDCILLCLLHWRWCN